MIDGIIKKWNEKVLSDPEASQFFSEMRDDVFVNGGRYRYSRWRCKNSKNENLFNGQDSEYLEVPLILGLRPALITEEQEKKVRRLGQVLCQMISSSAMVLADQFVQERINNVPLQEEWQRRHINFGYSFPAPWIRIDYIWRDDEPILVDSNMLPGGTFITHVLFQCFERAQKRYLEGVCIKFGYEPDILTKILVRCFVEWARSRNLNKERPRIGIVCRREHGLVPDMLLWVKALQAAGLEAEILYLDELPKDLPDLVVRMYRVFSKHVDPYDPRRQKERAAINLLFQKYENGEICFFPPFNLYLEDHQWVWFYQAERYREYFQNIADYAWFLKHIPQAWLVSQTFQGPVLIAANQVVFPCNRDSLGDKVLKQGPSTGAAGVTIIRRDSTSGKKYKEIFNICQLRKWLTLQELVLGSKEEYPILSNDGKVILVRGQMKYSAYFAAGEYFGGNAMCCPTSYKVHGGSGTYLVPVYTV